jgi:hypothetical protein
LRELLSKSRVQKEDETSLERIIDEEKTQESGFDDVERKRRAKEGPTAILYPWKAPMREASSAPS